MCNTWSIGCGRPVPPSAGAVIVSLSYLGRVLREITKVVDIFHLSAPSQRVQGYGVLRIRTLDARPRAWVEAYIMAIHT